MAISTLAKSFDLGDVLLSPMASEVLRSADESADSYLIRHATGDWGEHVNAGDAAVNAQQAAGCGMVFSAYQTESGAVLWVVTEFGHQITRVLLPEEHEANSL